MRKEKVKRFIKYLPKPSLSSSNLFSCPQNLFSNKPYLGMTPVHNLSSCFAPLFTVFLFSQILKPNWCFASHCRRKWGEVTPFCWESSGALPPELAWLFFSSLPEGSCLYISASCELSTSLICIKVSFINYYNLTPH